MESPMACLLHWMLMNGCAWDTHKLPCRGTSPSTSSSEKRRRIGQSSSLRAQGYFIPACMVRQFSEEEWRICTQTPAPVLFPACCNESWRICGFVWGLALTPSVAVPAYWEISFFGISFWLAQCAGCSASSSEKLRSLTVLRGELWICLCPAVQVLTVTLESLSCDDAKLPVPLGPRTESSLLSFTWQYRQILEAEKRDSCFSRC